MARTKAKSIEEEFEEKQTELENLKIEIKELGKRIEEIKMKKLVDAIKESGKTVDEVIAQITTK